jgi:hypothetical protein
VGDLPQLATLNLVIEKNDAPFYTVLLPTAVYLGGFFMQRGKT